MDSFLDTSKKGSMAPPMTTQQSKIFKEYAICDLTLYKTGQYVFIKLPLFLGSD
jgi:hypothetical protein